MYLQMETLYRRGKRDTLLLCIRATHPIGVSAVNRGKALRRTGRGY